MHVDIKKLPRGQQEITIELDAKAFEPFLEQAASAISQTKKIPGFRPGKAGLETVKRFVSEQELYEAALEPAVQKMFMRAVQEHKIFTVGAPHVDIVKLAPGNPVVFKATVSVLPSITLGDYATITVEPKTVIVRDEEVEKTIQDIQRMHAEEKPVETPAKQGDKVHIHFETFLDKVPIENGTYDEFPVLLGEGNFIPGFEEQLIGLKPNDTKTFQLTFPDNYHQKNLAGKLVDFKVNVKSVSEVRLAEANDALAQKLGSFKTMDELKKQVRDNIQREHEQGERLRQEELIMDELVAKSTFDDIPDILINGETEKMIEELEHNLTHQGVKFEDYLQHLRKSRGELVLDFAPQAVKRIKSALIMREIARVENLFATDEDIDEEIKKHLQTYANNPEAVKQINAPENRSYLRNVLTSRKVVDFLKQKATQKNK